MYIVIQQPQPLNTKQFLPFQGAKGDEHAAASLSYLLVLFTLFPPKAEQLAGSTQCTGTHESLRHMSIGCLLIPYFLSLEIIELIKWILLASV
jgi:hypothetical protein